MNDVSLCPIGLLLHDADLLAIRQLAEIADSKICGGRKPRQNNLAAGIAGAEPDRTAFHDITVDHKYGTGIAVGSHRFGGID
jgi:hypothetical protein